MSKETNFTLARNIVADFSPSRFELHPGNFLNSLWRTTRHWTGFRPSTRLFLLRIILALLLSRYVGEHVIRMYFRFAVCKCLISLVLLSAIERTYIHALLTN